MVIAMLELITAEEGLAVQLLSELRTHISFCPSWLMVFINRSGAILELSNFFPFTSSLYMLYVLPL
jgi:hypothetical protein